MRYIPLAIVASAGLLGFTASANAALIGLVGGSPDVASQAGSITYTDNVAPNTAGSGTFTLTATPATKNPGSITVNAAKSFTLTVNINHGAAAGDPDTVTGGSLTVIGDIGSGSTTLFSSSVTPQFGFSTSSNTPSFDVLFSSGTGSLDSGGGQIGLIIGAGTSISNYTTNLLTTSFSTSFTSSVDTFGTAVPEPASLMLAALGCGGLLMRRRRQTV